MISFLHIYPPSAFLQVYDLGVQVIQDNKYFQSLDGPQDIQQLLEQGQIVIVAGFQGITDERDITTLGRGGSDTTAVALAGALNAAECQIFTDVDGVYTCDPRLVPAARRLDLIHFDYMALMARHGAKVLQLQSVEYACEHSVPLRVLSSFEDGEGTLVNFDASTEATVVGIAIQGQHSLLNVSLPKVELQEQLSLFGLNVWSVTAGVNSTQIVAANGDLARLRLVLDNKMRHIEAVSILSIIGQNILDRAGSFHTILTDVGITVHQCQQATHCISFLINEKDHQLAADIVHKRFVVDPESLDNRQLLAVS